MSKYPESTVTTTSAVVQPVFFFWKLHECEAVTTSASSSSILLLPPAVKTNRKNNRANRTSNDDLSSSYHLLLLPLFLARVLSMRSKKHKQKEPFSHLSYYSLFRQPESCPNFFELFSRREGRFFHAGPHPFRRLNKRSFKLSAWSSLFPPPLSLPAPVVNKFFSSSSLLVKTPDEEGVDGREKRCNESLGANDKSAPRNESTVCTVLVCCST